MGFLGWLMSGCLSLPAGLLMLILVFVLLAAGWPEALLIGFVMVLIRQLCRR